MNLCSIALSLCLACLLLSACSESATAPNNEDTTGATPPRVGSSWVYTRFDADTTGTPMAGTIDTPTVVLSAVGLSFDGRSGVSLFTAGGDTMPMLRYESSGDLEWLPPFSRILSTGWIILPTATKGTTTKTLRDTSIDIGGGQMARNTVILTVAHVASEEIAVGSARVPAEKVRVQVVTTSPVTADQNLVETETVTLWYSARAGYFVREERSRSTESPFGLERFPTRVMQLFSYELK